MFLSKCKTILASLIRTSFAFNSCNSDDIELSSENNFNLDTNLVPFKYIFSDGVLSSDAETSSAIAWS